MKTPASDMKNGGQPNEGEKAGTCLPNHNMTPPENYHWRVGASACGHKVLTVVFGGVGHMYDVTAEATAKHGKRFPCVESDPLLRALYDMRSVRL